jgi:hypothetical protein
MRNFTADFRFKATLTNEDTIPDAATAGTGQLLTPDEVEAWLAADPLNAAILWGSHDDLFRDMEYQPPIFVAHTANPSLFYACEYPLPSEPDCIVEGEDLPETLRSATAEYYE